MSSLVLVIKDSEAPLYISGENTFGLVSRNGENFYKKGTIYHDDGKRYVIEGVDKINKAPFLTSLKYFQPMFIIQVKKKEINSITIGEFKKIVTEHIHKYKKYWIKKDLIENIEAEIESKESFSEIMSYLK